MSSDHQSDFPRHRQSIQSGTETPSISKEDILAMNVSGKPLSHAVRKPNTIEPRKALAIPKPPSPQIRGVFQHATIPGSHSHDDEGKSLEKCRVCRQFKQRGQPCSSCRQRANQEEPPYGEWPQQYASMQLSLLSELSAKTGKKYEDIRKQLRSGTPRLLWRHMSELKRRCD